MNQSKKIEDLELTILKLKEENKSYHRELEHAK
jgi:hypothetical protein